jgi:hypothetical protein
MIKIKYTGTYPVEVLSGPGALVGVVRQPGEEFEAGDELASDLLRRPDFTIVEEPKPRRRGGEEG